MKLFMASPGIPPTPPQVLDIFSNAPGFIIAFSTVVLNREYTFLYNEFLYDEKETDLSDFSHSDLISSIETLSTESTLHNFLPPINDECFFNTSHSSGVKLCCFHMY